MVQEEICTSEEDRNLSDDEDIEYTASNPIRLYKLISKMHKFGRDVYPQFLHRQLDTGIISNYNYGILCFLFKYKIMNLHENSLIFLFRTLLNIYIFIAPILTFRKLYHAYNFLRQVKKVTFNELDERNEIER